MDHRAGTDAERDGGQIERGEHVRDIGIQAECGLLRVAQVSAATSHDRRTLRQIGRRRTEGPLRQVVFPAVEGERFDIHQALVVDAGFDSRAGGYVDLVVAMCIRIVVKRHAVRDRRQRQHAAALMPALVATDAHHVAHRHVLQRLDLGVAQNANGVVFADGDIGNRHANGREQRIGVDVAAGEAIDDVYLAGRIAAGVQIDVLALYVGIVQRNAVLGVDRCVRVRAAATREGHRDRRIGICTRVGVGARRDVYVGCIGMHRSPIQVDAGT